MSTSPSNAPKIGCKITARYAKAAIRAGWTVRKTRSNHIAFVPPPGSGRPQVFTSGTPSDVRSTKNLRAQLKRAGLEVN